VRIDQPDDGDGEISPDMPEPHAAADSAHRAGGRGPAPDAPPGTAPGSGSADAAAKTERALAHRAAVDAEYRAYAIDQGCARVERIERETVTPALRRIEGEDPTRHLAGLEHRLKERYRIEEKVTEAVEERGHSVEEGFGLIKDAIRYTFCYPEERYTAGVYADTSRLEDAGFELFDRRNSWDHDEYKGVNSRWRISGNSQLFEVQFHTEASLAAKEETHDAYKQLRTLAGDDSEIGRLHAYQREVTAKVPIPPDALDIPDYP